MVHSFSLKVRKGGSEEEAVDLDDADEEDADEEDADAEDEAENDQLPFASFSWGSVDSSLSRTMGLLSIKKCVVSFSSLPFRR